METVIIQDVRGVEQVELTTHNAVVEISRHELSARFNLQEDTIRLRQIFGDQSDGLSFEMPTILRGESIMYHLDIQFGRIFVVHGTKLPIQVSTIVIEDECFIKEEVKESDNTSKIPTSISLGDTNVFSVVELLRNLPQKNSLRASFEMISEIRKVEELPQRYDGNILFELPSADLSTRTVGLENKFDGHIWTNAVTSNISGFEGVVRYRKCGGHLQCLNNLCSGLQRTKERNERFWEGRLSRVCPGGSTTDGFGSLKCFYCSTPPTCISECPCKLVLCLPTGIAGIRISRGIIHLGYHLHPVAEGVTKQALIEVQAKVKNMVSKDFVGRPRSLQQKLAKEIVMESALFGDHPEDAKLSDKDLIEVLAKLAPTLDKRRLSRWRKEAQVEAGYPTSDYDAVFKLKKRLLFDYFQSMAFPGQLEFSSFNRCHVFKMSTQGPGNGVELVNKMRPGGELGSCWVFFDFVKRMHEWTTMACHVYNPFVQELQTIAIGDFKVEDTEAQTLFWTLLNRVMEREGYKVAKFKGFMADEAQANWRAVRSVFNKGPDNVLVGQERSCSFHWEQSMQQHAKKCIPPHSQQEFKLRCRQWKAAPSEEAAEMELDNLRKWLRKGHADKTKISILETWLVWWHARVAHWGEYMVKAMEGNDKYLVPQANLAESVHGSWLASNDGVKYISLYSACYGDLMTNLIQQSKYNSFLKGGHLGCGPGIEKIKKRCASTSAIPPTPRMVVDLTNEAAVELNAANRRISVDGDSRTVRQKRRGGNQNPIRDGDSHRPEFEYITRSARQPTPSQNVNGRRSDVEVDIHPTRWAIRRTKPGSEVRCQGYLRNEKRKCNELIDKKGRAGLLGVPAPCFEGLIEIPLGPKKQFIWFCGNNIDHTWEPAKIVIERPASRPNKWPIEIGTSLDSIEIEVLWDGGFDLQNIETRPQHQARMGPLNTNQDIDVRPTHRDGKTVIVTRVVTKEMQTRINKAAEMVCIVYRHNVVVKNEHVEFTLSTEGCTQNEGTYLVVVCTFPSCTCEDFQKRAHDGKKYMPCKHLYFIYTNQLGLDVVHQKFVHQAALTRRELHQALRLVG